MSAQTPGRFLIIKLSFAGDILMALPVLRALRAAYPEAFVGWMVDERFADVLLQEPQVDRLHVLPHHRWRRMLRSPGQWAAVRREVAEFRHELREGRYEVCLDLHGMLKSALAGSWARAPHCLRRAGDRLGRLGWLFPAERIPPVGPHTIETMLPLAAALGADISEGRFDYFIPEADRAQAAELIAGHDFGAAGPLVALNAGASHPAKTWPAERFAAVASSLHESAGARIIVLGGPSEVALAEQVVSASGVPALCTAGRTSFRLLAAVLERCDTLVTGDTGPMHLAAAVGTPCVVACGSTDPAVTGPWGPGHVIVRTTYPCPPCDVRPTCTGFPCMKAIEVDDVVEAVTGLL